jgi:S1-C subfamily serine protease
MASEMGVEFRCRHTFTALGEIMSANRRSSLTFLAFAAIICSACLTAAPQTCVAQLPPSQPASSSIAQFESSAKTIKLPDVYSRVAHKKFNYHDPILTRSASGISVFRAASPAVVLIVVGDVKNDQFNPTGLGSGVVIDSTGDILTNWHVINGYTAAVIFFKPLVGTDVENSKAYVGKLVDQAETSDLALLHLTEDPPSKTSISIGNISSVQVAEDIHVIGHPEGNPWSYSTGVVSQIRDGFEWTYTDGSKHQAKVLQLQTAISPGNSGGPVLDDQGRLLGLIAMSQEGQNLDYAVAADVIQNFVSKAH